MDESDVIRLALLSHLAKHREVLRVAGADPAAQLVASGRRQMIEGTALPTGRGLADVRRPVLDDWRLLDAVGAPAKRPAFVDRMQRIDDHRGAGKRDARFASAISEAVEGVRLGCAGETGLDEPGFDAVQWIDGHWRRGSFKSSIDA